MSAEEDRPMTVAQRTPLEVRVIDGPHSGLADNFWQAAQQAGRDLIAWADQDDL